MAGGIEKRLTEKTIKGWKDKAEPGNKLADGGGLHLFMTRAGTTTWRIKYKFGGKEGTYSPGPYPAISLATARAELEYVRAQLREHKDPVNERRLRRIEGAQAVAHTFRAAATEWLGKKKAEWSEGHHTRSERAFERDVLPLLGNVPIASVSTAMVATVLEKIAKREATETAKRVHTQINGVFRYAIAKGWCSANPAPEAAAVLPRKKTPARMAALLTWRELGAILKLARGTRVSRPVYMAHRLIAFTAMRIRNVVDAQWSEFDLDSAAPVWVIPRTQMKKKNLRFTDHRVPLAPGIAGELREWRKVAAKSRFVFPAPSDPTRPIGRESLEKAYRVSFGLAGQHSPHGWRSALATLALDNRFNNEVVHMACDRAHGSEVALAYDRGERFDQRIALFTWWEQQLLAAEGIMPRSAANEDSIKETLAHA